MILRKIKRWEVNHKSMLTVIELIKTNVSKGPNNKPKAGNPSDKSFC